MIRLIEPDKKYLTSYIEAYDEYQDKGITDYGFTDARNCDLLAKFENYRLERNLKPDRVGSHSYWLVDDERDYFIGEITIRHKLTDALLRRGGHIGYGIRYAEWRKGYGTLMLQLALEKAKMIGLSKVLITCDDRNLGSAGVMEKNGCILQDKIKNITDSGEIITRRYWKTL